MNAIGGTLSLRDTATYIWAALFVAANFITPQIFHALNLGGSVFLPIIFFTVIAAGRFGLATGVLTALLSPLASFAITRMPSGAMLATVLTTSLILASLIGLWRERGNRFSILAVVTLIVACSVLGFVLNGLFFSDFDQAWNYLVGSWPGVLLQMVALWGATRKV